MPRAGLTRDKVVDAAAEAADDVGFEHITLAGLADRFDVAVPSLYKHIGGLDDLRRELRILGLRQLADGLSKATVGKSKGDAIDALADSYRSYALAHPGTYAGTARAPEPDDPDHLRAAAELLQVVFDVLAGYGIEGNDAIDATRMLHASLHGFVTLEHGGSFKMAHSVDESYQRLVRALALSLTNWSKIVSERAAPRGAR